MQNDLHSQRERGWRGRRSNDREQNRFYRPDGRSAAAAQPGSVRSSACAGDGCFADYRRISRKQGARVFRRSDGIADQRDISDLRTGHHPAEFRAGWLRRAAAVHHGAGWRSDRDLSGHRPADRRADGRRRGDPHGRLLLPGAAGIPAAAALFSAHRGRDDAPSRIGKPRAHLRRHDHRQAGERGLRRSDECRACPCDDRADGDLREKSSRARFSGSR